MSVGTPIENGRRNLFDINAIETADVYGRHTVTVLVYAVCEGLYTTLLAENMLNNLLVETVLCEAILA